MVGERIPPHKSFRFSIESKLNELEEEEEGKPRVEKKKRRTRSSLVDSFLPTFLGKEAFRDNVKVPAAAALVSLIPLSEQPRTLT